MRQLSRQGRKTALTRVQRETMAEAEESIGIPSSSEEDEDYVPKTPTSSKKRWPTPHSSGQKKISRTKKCRRNQQKKQAQSAKQQSLVVDSDSDYVCEEKEMDDESGTKSAPSTMKKINSVANKTIGFVLPTVVVDGGETMTTIPNTIRENNASNVMDSVSVITQSVSRGDSQLLASRSSQASATTGLKMITYKYVQKKKKVDRKVMQEQLKILGLKDATTEEIDFHVKQSKKIRETVITLAQNRIQSVMITEAQRLQI
jgi:hypothetical protein